MSSTSSACFAPRAIMSELRPFDGEPPKPSANRERKPSKRAVKAPVDDNATGAPPPLPPKEPPEPYSHDVSDNLIDLRDPADGMIMEPVAGGLLPSQPRRARSLSLDEEGHEAYRDASEGRSMSSPHTPRSHPAFAAPSSSLGFPPPSSYPPSLPPDSSDEASSFSSSFQKHLEAARSGTTETAAAAPSTAGQSPTARRRLQKAKRRSDEPAPAYEDPAGWWETEDDASSAYETYPRRGQDKQPPRRPEAEREAELIHQFTRELERMEQEARIEKRRLKEAVKEAQSRAEQAERAADALRLQHAAESKRAAAVAAAAAEAAGSGDDRAVMQAEIQRLQAELDEARSHIFSLQPYLKDLTPKEVAQDFDDLVNAANDWVTAVMEPILDDEDRFEQVLARARRSSQDVQGLRRYLQAHPDLVYGCRYPETDIDVIIALVLRYLQDNVFQKPLYGAVPQLVSAISFLEASMQTNVQPKRDQFALRTWRAEALNAVIHSADYHKARWKRARELTFELGSLLSVFRKDKDDWQHKALRGLHDEMVVPAIRLHEKLMTSTHHFYLDLSTYMIWAGRQHEFEPNPDFWRDAGQLRCENILQNRKPFVLSKLDPAPGAEDLFRDLMPVATVAPALYMRQVGKGDVIKEPTPVRQQHVLVAWGPEEKRQRFLDRGQRTLVHHIYYSARERPERLQESGVPGFWPFPRGWP
ncbi:hypothetical protein VTJ83DRAFT_6915 [Remersonia thermophila]|uniref:Uncharacterized protein n=1 Tax=Remersonia thermophila TaxID=72144 RepID=A0ABR4D6W3_9PEZI